MHNSETLSQELYTKENVLAEEAINAENLPEAARILVEIIEKDPVNFRAYNNLGIISWVRKFWSDAFVMFKKSVECNPVYIDALLNLFDASLKLRKIPEIIPCFEKAVQIQSGLEEIREILDVIKSSGDAIYSSQRALAIGIYSPLCDEAEKELNSGNFMKAMELFLKVIDTEGPDARAFCGLGIVSYQMEKYTDSFSLFMESIKLNPTDPDTYLNLLDAANRCDMTAAAKEVYQNNRIKFPNIEVVSESFESL